MNKKVKKVYTTLVENYIFDKIIYIESVKEA